jgi:uncharacterized protein (DUF305 family)
MRWSRFQVVSLTIALMFLAGVGGWALAQDRPPGKGSADVGFLYDMILHHEQAQQIATLELGQGESEQAKVFAREILLFQSYEIGLMEARLNEWGHDRQDRPARAMAWMDMSVEPERMPGLATETEMRSLTGATGADADAQFFALMIRHHQGGIHMASFIGLHGDDDEVQALGSRMSRNQQQEITELRQTRERLGLPDVPYRA